MELILKMSNVLQSVQIAKKQGDEWGTFVELPTARNISIQSGWGSIKDSASFDLSNGIKFFDSDTSNSPLIEEQDLVRIYLAKNKALDYEWTNDDLFFEGTVRDLPQSIDDNGNIVQLGMLNWFEVFFDVEIPVYKTELTWVEMFREFVEVDLRKAGTIIDWDPANPTVKKDGTSFPQKELALNYTPFFVIAEKLTSSEYTDDGQYVYYISRGTTGRRQLSIRAKSSSTESLEINDSTLPIIDCGIERGKDAIINYIIYNVGMDLYGNSVEDFTYDPSSIGKYGWKTDYIFEETGQFFQAVFRDEVLQNASSFSFDSNDNLNDDFPSSYPYTFAYDGTVVNNDSDFNETIRNIALSLGLEFSNALIEQRAKAQYVLNVTFPIRFDIVMGAKYNINLSKLRSFTKPLRVKNINYTINTTTVTFDEDITDRE